MEFRRNQEEMVGYNPQIRPSAFSKPLLPPTASLLGTPRNNGVSTTTSDVFNPVVSVPAKDLDPATAVAASVVVGVGDAFTATTVTPSLTVARSKLINDSSASGEARAKYRECLRNHAASLGGYVLDGCGDFMPAGESDPLKCAACGCHRSFHRREVEGESGYFNRFGNGSASHAVGRGGRVPLLPPPPPLHHHPPSPPQQWLPRSPGGAAAAAAAFGGNYSGSGGATTESSSEENPGGPGAEPGPPQAAPGSSSRKRFRSKFTTEQKKRMLAFAESVGWRMQKQDEALVEQFCAEVGVRRQVLKVWMHNNKHTVRRQQQEHQQHQQIQREHQQHQQIQHQQQHHQQEQQQQHNHQQQLH